MNHIAKAAIGAVVEQRAGRLYGSQAPELLKDRVVGRVPRLGQGDLPSALGTEQIHSFRKRFVAGLTKRRSKEIE